MPDVLCVDVGGTRTKWAAARGGELRAPGSAASPRRYDDLVAMLRGLADGHGTDRVAVAVPGPVADGVWLRTVQPFAVRDVPLAHDLRANGLTPVCLMHDTTAALTGEAAGTDGCLCLLQLSTGVGVGVACDGEPVAAVGSDALRERDLGMHLAHTSLRPGGAACHCGGAGCVSAYVAWGAVGRRLGSAGSSPGEVASRAADGDERAAAVIDDWLEGVAYLSAALVATVRPKELRLAGGVAGALAGVIDDRFHAELARRLPPYLRDGVTVSRSTLGDRAGLLGLLAAADRATAP